MGSIIIKKATTMFIRGLLMPESPFTLKQKKRATNFVTL